ncbi:hypothetical protein HK100_002337, partial [Physocladia obscura]
MAPEAITTTTTVQYHQEERLRQRHVNGSTIKNKKSSNNAADNSVAWRSSRHPLTTSAAYAKQFEHAPFTLKELRDAVPAWCFKHNTLLSLAYVAFDVAMAAGLFALATNIDSVFGGSPVARFSAWMVYAAVQGWVCTGIWVLAHECGHGGFSANTTLNHVVGWVLHSALLVPYFSWKISHSKHHKNCGNLDKDQVFIPDKRSDREERVRPAGVTPLVEHGQEEEEEGDIFESPPIVDLLRIVRQQLFGWPSYIIANVSGQKYSTYTSHFHPSSQIFDSHHHRQVILSDIGIAIMLLVLGFLVHKFSFLAVAKYYLLPYLWVNHWLVMVTFLQHTDVRLPHYRGDDWTFLRGALCTVDRDFGFLNFFFHHMWGLTDTHVVHHLFSQMPFYNAQVATAAVKEKLGKFYLYDDSPIFLSLWRSYRSCQFVEDEGGVVGETKPEPIDRALAIKIAKMKSTKDIIIEHQFPCEEHSAHVFDGTIIRLFRIPNGRYAGTRYVSDVNNPSPPAVLLWHGLGLNSACWVCSPSKNPQHDNLAFLLADSGFDVWLVDGRGSNPMEHSTAAKYPWTFSLDDIARLDVPAVVDFVLNRTGRASLALIGFSQGSTSAFAALALSEELNKKIH